MVMKKKLIKKDLIQKMVEVLKLLVMIELKIKFSIGLKNNLQTMVTDLQNIDA